MTMELHTRFPGTHDLIEMECKDETCDGRMLVNSDTAGRLGLECPMPTCDAEVRTA